jgi:hypothetical protein
MPVPNPGTKRRPIAGLLLTAFAILFSSIPAQAGKIYVPNRSFELPGAPAEFPYADFQVTDWAKSPAPPWYNPATNQFTPWEYLTGTFTNAPFPGSFIDNCDGVNGGFMFAHPEVALLQDYNTIYGTNASPTHAFDAKYAVGRYYDLTVAVLGAGPGMSNDATMQCNLYYRDASNNIVVVASTSVTNDTTTFSNHTHFVDFLVHTSTVRDTDAWAGKNIGIQLLSTSTTNNVGGYWDVDNVRLTENIEVPNYSFELPGAPAEFPYADFPITEWAKSPAPPWYNPATNQFTPWEYLTGTFTNAPFPGSFIDNCDGVNAGFMFAHPEVALLQDNNTIYGTNSSPTHAFNAKYVAGKSYELTVAVLGGGAGMSNDATIQCSLYYRDSASNIVVVASTTATNDTGTFPNHTHFVDFKAKIPVVNAIDLWAGKNIGIRLLSTSTTNNTGGYWDVDNVRLVETTATALSGPVKTNNQFKLTLASEPDSAFDVIASSNISQASSNWTVVGRITNITGEGTVTDAETNHTQRFYRARGL